MTFWTDFENELNKAFVAAKAAIDQAGQYFKPMVEAGASEIASAALQAVLQQAPLLISGQTKLKNATGAVVTALANSGKSVAVNIAETAVQAAVNKLAQK